MNQKVIIWPGKMKRLMMKNIVIRWEMIYLFVQGTGTEIF